MTGYILDTNVYNRALDGGIELPALDDGLRHFATHIQLDELSETPDKTRQARLLAQFRAFAAETLPTESLVLDVLRLSMAKLSDGVLLSQSRNLLDARNSRKANNAQDALIAETAIKNSLTLVTEDGDLLAVTRELGGQALRPAEMGRAAPDGGK